MRVLTNPEIKTILGAQGNELVPFFDCNNSLTLTPNMADHSDFRSPSIAAALLILTFGFNTAATATLKPSIPFWGIPVTLAFGLALSGTVLLLDQAIDWIQPNF